MSPGQRSQRHLTAARGFTLLGNGMPTTHQQCPQNRARAVSRQGNQYTVIERKAEAVKVIVKP